MLILCVTLYILGVFMYTFIEGDKADATIGILWPFACLVACIIVAATFAFVSISIATNWVLHSIPSIGRINNRGIKSVKQGNST